MLILVSWIGILAADFGELVIGQLCWVRIARVIFKGGSLMAAAAQRQLGGGESIILVLRSDKFELVKIKEKNSSSADSGIKEGKNRFFTVVG